MARTGITPQKPKGPYPASVAANDLDLAFTAADASNLNEAEFKGNRMLLLWRNTGAGARTVTITSAAHSTSRRSADVSAFSQGAGESGSFLVERDGWQQSDGKLYFQAEHAEVVFAVVELP